MSKLHNFIYPSYAVLVTIAYVLIGVFAGVWHPTWLLFLTIPCYYMLVEFFRLERRGKRGKWNVFPYPILCVILFLTLGFDYGRWHPGWVIFLTIPVFYIFANARGK